MERVNTKERANRGVLVKMSNDFGYPGRARDVWAACAVTEYIFVIWSLEPLVARKFI
jgi:hypothetical protein